MPSYDYKCSRCAVVFEHTCSWADYRPEMGCPECGAHGHRIYTSPQVYEVETLPEFVQWSRPDPSKPGGYDVRPHKNRYVRGV